MADIENVIAGVCNELSGLKRISFYHSIYQFESVDDKSSNDTAAVDTLNFVDSEDDSLILEVKMQLEVFAHRELVTQFIGNLSPQILNAIKRIEKFNRTRESTVELRRKNFKLEKIEQNRQRFLAGVTHDLRTPIQVIQGWTQLIQSDQTLPPEISEALEQITEVAALQKRLVDDLLDSTSILHGKLCIKIDSVDLVALVKKTCNAFQPIANRSDVLISFQTELKSATGLFDRDRLQQVFNNIINNALKAVNSGGTIKLSLTRTTDSYQLAIKDDGIGIASDKLEQVFEPFSRGDYNSNNEEGVGLGLSIAKNLVDLHRGSIEVSSPGLGKGACFIICLPA